MEDTYFELYPQISEDFVHRDDFIRVVEAILEKVDPDGELGVDVHSMIGATEKALQYDG